MVERRATDVGHSRDQQSVLLREAAQHVEVRCSARDVPGERRRRVCRATPRPATAPPPVRRCVAWNGDSARPEAGGAARRVGAVVLR
jgi:hypothetical protein